jgi:hypothetical protein
VKSFGGKWSLVVFGGKFKNIIFVLIGQWLEVDAIQASAS